MSVQGMTCPILAVNGDAMLASPGFTIGACHQLSVLASFPKQAYPSELIWAQEANLGAGSIRQKCCFITYENGKSQRPGIPKLSASYVE